MAMGSLASAGGDRLTQRLREVKKLRRIQECLTITIMYSVSVVGQNQ
jgi:hypothetical protein